LLELINLYLPPKFLQKRLQKPPPSFFHGAFANARVFIWCRRPCENVEYVGLFSNTDRIHYQLVNYNLQYTADTVTLESRSHGWLAQKFYRINNQRKKCKSEKKL